IGASADSSPASGRPGVVDWLEAGDRAGHSVGNARKHAVQLAAIVHGHARELYGNRRRCDAPQLANRRSRSRVRRALELFCQFPLSNIGKLAAEQIGRAHVELQSLAYLVCRLLLEKKKQINRISTN